jgi:peptide-methionine (S)-S-oxide reductase
VISFLSKKSRFLNLKRLVAIALLVCLYVLFYWVLPVNAQALSKATFAGGCFWCMEKPFDQLQGVVSTTSGYTGGQLPTPTYPQVSSGTTGHAESVQVVYDPTQVSYEKLLDVFWHNVDPVDTGGQFCDRGSQYRSSVFYQDEAQQKLAAQSKVAIATQLEQPVATDIVQASEFYPAEDYHQNYYQTHAAKYRFYRFACGRDQRLADVWGDRAVQASKP